MQFLWILFSLTVFAGDNPRPEMHGLLHELNVLQKFLLSEKEFLSSENEKTIRKSLAGMNEHLRKLDRSFLDDPALRVNLTLLREHMNDAERFFAGGNKLFARYMTQSALQMCIACHTRSEVKADFALPREEMTKGISIEKADFLFATRQFEAGREMYEKVIDSYGKEGVTSYVARRALEALAVYYARVKEDPTRASNYFQKVGQRSDFPEYLKKDAKQWATDFSAWAGEKKEGKSGSASVLLARAKKLLKSDDFSLAGDSERKFHIRRLRASALLHKVLESPGNRSPEKGEALHLLGQLYRRMDHQLFFRFGEMYLKACILEYPGTKTARDCYSALEEIVLEGYTGSAGTKIPDEERAELKELKEKAY